MILENDEKLQIWIDEENDIYEMDVEDDTYPTIVTNYIGRWVPMYAEDTMYLFSGFGAMINIEDKRLSSKKLERIIGYAYKKPENTQYTVYFETLPKDGSYWHVVLKNITLGYTKYTLVYDYNGQTWVWGQSTKDTSKNPPIDG
jgi:signal transduction histidine kinase